MLIFWIFLGNVVCVLAHQLLGPWDVVTAVMSQEALQEKEFAKRGNKGSQGQVKINMPHVSVFTVMISHLTGHDGLSICLPCTTRRGIVFCLYIVICFRYMRLV